MVGHHWKKSPKWGKFAKNSGKEIAVSLLLNLDAAQQGRSMLFSDKQKLLFEGRKKGFA
jgi:hypothetical protein